MKSLSSQAVQELVGSSAFPPIQVLVDYDFIKG